jgi:CBS domain containing-hemolysin-like protein
MISRVLDLQNTPVRQIAIPMRDALCVTTTTPLGEALKLAQAKRITRVPVWRGEGSERRIAGIVSIRTILFLPELERNKTAGDYLKPALYFDADLTLETALKRMQRSGQRLAIVLGADQREVGIVSLQDILRKIFGEVRL